MIQKAFNKLRNNVSNVFHLILIFFIAIIQVFIIIVCCILSFLCIPFLSSEKHKELTDAIYKILKSLLNLI